jgi:hypothetical protein
MDTKYQILDKIAKGDLATARKLAERWTARDPDDLMAWIILADVHLARKDIEGVRNSLEGASRIDSSHPMFYRTVCLGAIEARSFTAAHGAAFNAFLTGLPAEIRNDLVKRIKECGAVFDENGSWPEPESTDSTFRTFLPRTWHVRDDRVELVWAKQSRKIHINDKNFINVIQLVSTGKRLDRKKVPEACAGWLEALIGHFPDTAEVEPWMLIGPATCYPAMLLHMAGYVPEKIESNLMVTNTPHGDLVWGVTTPAACCTATKAGLVEFLKGIAANALEGRISFEGPSKAYQSVLGWMTRG